MKDMAARNCFELDALLANAAEGAREEVGSVVFVEHVVVLL